MRVQKTVLAVIAVACAGPSSGIAKSGVVASSFPSTVDECPEALAARLSTYWDHPRARVKLERLWLQWMAAHGEDDRAKEWARRLIAGGDPIDWSNVMHAIENAAGCIEDLEKLELEPISGKRTLRLEVNQRGLANHSIDGATVIVNGTTKLSIDPQALAAGVELELPGRTASFELQLHHKKTTRASYRQLVATRSGNVDLSQWRTPDWKTITIRFDAYERELSAEERQHNREVDAYDFSRPTKRHPRKISGPAFVIARSVRLDDRPAIVEIPSGGELGSARH